MDRNDDRNETMTFCALPPHEIPGRPMPPRKPVCWESPRHEPTRTVPVRAIRPHNRPSCKNELQGQQSSSNSEVLAPDSCGHFATLRTHLGIRRSDLARCWSDVGQAWPDVGSIWPKRGQRFLSFHKQPQQQHQPNPQEEGEEGPKKRKIGGGNRNTTKHGLGIHGGHHPDGHEKRPRRTSDRQAKRMATTLQKTKLKTDGLTTPANNLAHLAKLDEWWPHSANNDQISPNLANIGHKLPTSTKAGRAKVGQVWPNATDCVQHREKHGQNRNKSGRTLPKLTNVGQTVVTYLTYIGQHSSQSPSTFNLTSAT